MAKQGGRANYTAICLSKELMADVKNYIKINQTYRSQAEFVKIAIMEKIQREIEYGNYFGRQNTLSFFYDKQANDMSMTSNIEDKTNGIEYRLDLIEKRIQKLLEKLDKV